MADEERVVEAWRSLRPWQRTAAYLGLRDRLAREIRARRRLARAPRTSDPAEIEALREQLAAARRDADAFQRRLQEAVAEVAAARGEAEDPRIVSLQERVDGLRQARDNLLEEREMLNARLDALRARLREREELERELEAARATLERRTEQRDVAWRRIRLLEKQADPPPRADGRRAGAFDGHR